MADAMCSHDLVEKYKLQRVNSHPSNFNLSIVQEFYSSFSLKFSESGRVVYVRGINVPFNPFVVCSTLGLDISSAFDISAFNTVVCHYDMNA